MDIRTTPLQKLVAYTGELTRHHFGRSVAISHPGLFRIDGQFGRTRAISITGRECELNCKHCCGRLLQGMANGSTPQRFREKCMDWADRNVPGILISGGANRQGQLPWHRFLPAIKHIKQYTKMHLAIHMGLAPTDTLQDLFHAGIDLFMFDLVPSPAIFKRVFRQNDGYERMLAMITSLKTLQTTCAPHLILGLSTELEDYYSVLELLAGLNMESIVILQFMPLPATPMAEAPTIDSDSLIRIIAATRLKYPNIEISLGCARKRPDAILEQRAIDAGITRIAIPEKSTIEYITKIGLHPRKYSQCCAIQRNLQPDSGDTIHDPSKP